MMLDTKREIRRW